MQQKTLIRLGADPEVFVLKDGAPFPSCDLFGGVKGAPVPFYTGAGLTYSYLEDNVALELNFTPQSSAGDFAAVVADIRKKLSSVLLQKGFDGYSKSAAVQFQPSQLNTEKAQCVGCSPDMCAYDEPGTLRVVQPNDLGNWRYGAGHFHLSYNKKRIPDYAMVALLDAFVGLALMPYENQGARRKMYGLAGLYRETSYGVEYRTPSNWWFTTAPLSILEYIATSVLTLTNAVDMHPEKLAAVYNQLPMKDVRSTINSEDFGNAYRLVRELDSLSRTTLGRGLTYLLTESQKTLVGVTMRAKKPKAA